MSNQNDQELLVRVLDLFAEKFREKAILGGGMAMRLLGCERLTNDLDYMFVPYKSKNDIVELIISALNEIPDAKISHSINSKCLRIVLTVADAQVQIEAKVAWQLPFAIVSTGDLTKKYNLTPRLIRVLDYPVALAHKLAAWNERRLMRDIYDIWFYLKMGVLPDSEVLLKRLKKCTYSRLIKEGDKFQGSTLNEFYDFLSSKVNLLTDEQVSNALEAFLPQSDLPGLAIKFKSEMIRLK